MTDIVERIRNRIHDSHMDAEHLMDEAADEIERLRGIIDKAFKNLDVALSMPVNEQRGVVDGNHAPG
jgi:cobalamin biosynthesis protein CobT